MTLKQRGFVCASKNLGASDRYVIFHHIIPNMVGQISVAATLGIAHAILTESFLSYIGLGVQLPRASFHPYTQALLSAVPIPDPVISKEKQRIIMGGDVPSPIDPPQGCRFCTRCEYADEKCRTQMMQLVEVSDGHFVSCVKATM
ncbi:oligopeptide/dipeptide ABC transporter ATP-binding protein [Faecalicatena contorta]|uniref:oligopeptide/dipeptide ABC transporter ATP-binding protein n=1 Tax=Faecalicatena contorta TaxID=39482 RepID=UPI001F31BDD0|nr:oligopeptide/dipeptide ABC transporter ATP-binding protein [Faecalicatena contorta]MCF2681629.1 ABC transporter permease subunit [Faecalicatena contorta]